MVSDGDDFTLVASGSELEIAFKIKAALLEYSVRIISVPILNKLSNMQNEEINELLKNKHVFPIELGRSIGWESYLGRITKTFSIDSFGESAPIEDLEKNFGFVEEVINAPGPSSFSILSNALAISLTKVVFQRFSSESIVK